MGMMRRARIIRTIRPPIVIATHLIAFIIYLRAVVLLTDYPRHDSQKKYRIPFNFIVVLI
jgi:hypothetical protein